jgi:hypothetical protein
MAKVMQQERTRAQAEVREPNWGNDNQLLELLLGQGPDKKGTTFRYFGDADLPVRSTQQVALDAARDTVLAQSQQAGLPLPFVGFVPLFEQPRLYRGTNVDVWLVNMHDDPWFHYWYGPSAPRRVIEELKMLQKHVGLDFHLYVAHEIPAGELADGETPPREMLLPPPSQRVQGISPELGNACNRGWRGLATCLKLPITALNAAARGMGVALSSAHDALEQQRQARIRAAAARQAEREAEQRRRAASAITSSSSSYDYDYYDPIILGAVLGIGGRSPQPGQLAAWFQLASWLNGEE